jgi:hypothetical protein
MASLGPKGTGVERFHQSQHHGYPAGRGCAHQLGTRNDLQVATAMQMPDLLGAHTFKYRAAAVPTARDCLGADFLEKGRLGQRNSSNSGVPSGFRRSYLSLFSR